MGKRRVKEKGAWKRIYGNRNCTLRTLSQVRSLFPFLSLRSFQGTVSYISYLISKLEEGRGSQSKEAAANCYSTYPAYRSFAISRDAEKLRELSELI